MYYGVNVQQAFSNNVIVGYRIQYWYSLSIFDSRSPVRQSFMCASLPTQPQSFTQKERNSP